MYQRRWVLRSMAKIFISYRRQDSAGAAGRIYDRLRDHFGEGAVFIDLDSIPFGVDFREHVASAMEQCGVLLAVIGRNWTGAAGAARRLDDPRDSVRIEVEAALNRNLPVIPILIDRTTMPGEADLPPSLARLAYRNAIDVDLGRDFHHHVDRLIKGVERFFPQPGAGASPRVPQPGSQVTGASTGIAKNCQREADIARLKLAYETARAGAKLFAARGALEAWARLVEPDSPELRAAWAELTRRLSQAEAAVARARGLERTDPAAARALYRRILSLAVDLPDALAGLNRTPPDPPSTLDAQVMGDRIRLVWTPPPPDDLGALTFVVVRKRGGEFKHPGDGTRIAEISTTEFDDTQVTPGDTVAYAILTKRGHVESVKAVSLGPLVFLADVKDVRVEIREHEVELAWTPPRGVFEVRLVRKQGSPPKNPRDGDRVASGLDHALDRNVGRDEVYYYGIYSVYKMPDGRLFPAPGNIVSARLKPAGPVAKE